MVGISKEIPAGMVENEMKAALKKMSGSETPEFAVVQGYPPGMPYDENEFKKKSWIR